MTYVIKLSIIDTIFQKIIDIFHIYFLYNMTKNLFERYDSRLKFRLLYSFQLILYSLSIRSL